jgi:hypothetical protein
MWSWYAVDRDFAAGISQQVLQHSQLAAGELQQLGAAADFARHRVELHITCPQHSIARWPDAARQRTDAREQLHEGERFDKVIISPTMKTRDAIVDGITRSG